MVAIGTGDVRYAKAFVSEEQIDFPVLVDDDAAAAHAASVRKASIFSLAGPRTWGGSRQAHRDGFRVRRTGKRVTQLGATFVMGPGSPRALRGRRLTLLRARAARRRVGGPAFIRLTAFTRLTAARPG